MIKQLIVCDQCHKEVVRDKYISTELFVVSHGESFVRHFCYECCRKGVILDVED